MCILLAGNRNIAPTNAKMLSPITNTKITYLSKNAGDKEECFLFNKKAAVVNDVATTEIKLRLLSTTLIHQPNLFKLTSEDAQTLYGTHY